MDVIDTVEIKLLKNFLSGGFGSLLAEFLFYPLDTLRTRAQVF